MQRQPMRAALLIAVLATLLAGCAALTAPPTLSEADRCGRWGGSYDGHTCRHGSGP
jgi:hypothetical protein